MPNNTTELAKKAIAQGYFFAVMANYEGMGYGRPIMISKHKTEKAAIAAKKLNRFAVAVDLRCEVS